MYERYPVTQEEAIRAQADVFCYSALRRWFDALPEDAYQTAGSATVPNTGYHVRIHGGWAHKALTAIFTPLEDRQAPVVSVRARTAPGNSTADADLLAHAQLVWQRDASSILTLRAPGTRYSARSISSTANPYLIRVENDAYVDTALAETSTITIGQMLREQMQAQAPAPDGNS